MATIPVLNQLYRSDDNGKPSYQVLPDYNVSNQLTKVDPSEYGGIDPNLVSQVGKNSNYILNNGVFTQQSAVDQEAANKAGVASGSLREISSL